MLGGPGRARIAMPVACLAVACSGAPGESVGESSAASTPTYGVDYSFARPSPASIVAQGFTFAARYVSGDPGGGKDISAGEANALIGAGLTVVLVWEESSTNSLSGYGQGVSDAQAAAAEAASVGQPEDRPIYFAVDFDAESGDMGAIESYFDGVASVIGVGRTGVYGGIYTVSTLFDAGEVAWGWQTYAWSDGAWDGRAQLRQIQNGIDGDSEDEDEGVAADFGQWPIAPPLQPVRGSLDSVTCDAISGWAQDPNTGSTAIAVDVYIDGPAGSGWDLGRFTAGDSRSDLCGAIGSCDHAFTVRPPSSLYDGHAHSVYAYAIAATSGVQNGLLSNAPKTLQCATALTGDFYGSGSTDILQFRDDWTTLPVCARWGSDWSCSNESATYLGGIGAGNSGAAVYGGATPFVGDVNGDGKDNLVEWSAAWQSIPVCFSTGGSWACENQRAEYVGGLGAGNDGTGVYSGGSALVGDVNGDGRADVVQYAPDWTSFPVCFAVDDGWACDNLGAEYLGGGGAGNSGSGVYGSAFGQGTSVLLGDVNGDGRADVLQFNPSWSTIPVCFATDRGWSCENLAAPFVGGAFGAGNSGSGIYSGSNVFVADVNGDGKADVVQWSDGWQSIPVCFSTGHGWSCENEAAVYVGGIGAGNGGSGVYAGGTPLVADVNGDGKADVLEYSDGWQSIPVCLSTEHGWSCENLAASEPSGSEGSGVHPFGVPLAGKFEGERGSGIAEINPDSGWTTLPMCALGGSGWSCTASAAAVY